MQEQQIIKKNTYQYHFFLDEAGDTSFFGKGKVPIIGIDGVSNYFILGMVIFDSPLKEIREQIMALKQTVETDPYFKGIPSIERAKNKHGYFFHATKDIPEVRMLFYNLIKKLQFQFYGIVCQKDITLFSKKHNGKENEFYADILSHLLAELNDSQPKFILNIAQRGSSTRNENLQLALAKYKKRLLNSGNEITIEFNVQDQIHEPLLNIADYLSWAVQRLYEKNENRFYDYLKEQIKITELFFSEEGESSKKTIENKTEEK